MKRMHIHVSVDNIEHSTDFYSTLFASPPSVIKPDYVKWMLDDPRINFAISARGAPVGIDHLGIQVESDEALQEMHERLKQLPSELIEQTGTACCYAQSDKYWVRDPAGIAWETYHTLHGVPMFSNEAQNGDSQCGTPSADVPASSCCAPGLSAAKATHANTEASADVTTKSATQASGSCCAPKSGCC